VKQDDFENRFKEWKNTSDTYFVVVIEDTDAKKLIGSATLFVEKKIVHEGGLVS
jgi:hypothetical protein